MDSFQQQQWNYPLQEPTYNAAVSPSVSSYFTRPTKIVKSGSRNNSPRIMGRRKTTSSTLNSARTNSLGEHLRLSTQWQNQESTRSRPLSWHPTSFEASNFNFSNSGVDGQDMNTWNFSTAQVNGLVTPISYPTMNEPHINEIFTPLDEMPMQDSMLCYESQPLHEQMWLNHEQAKPDLYSLPLYPQQPLIHSSWEFNQMAMLPNAQTAPSSPDWPPMQTIGLDTLSLTHKDSASSEDGPEELVGMGLYDSPAEVQSSSLLFSGLSGPSRKGLKLEESFEPVEQEDEEEEEDDEEAPEQDEVDDKTAQDAPVEEVWISGTPCYESPSIADHLTYGIQPQPDSVASRYLATLRQLNSAYYPSGRSSYGWV